MTDEVRETVDFWFDPACPYTWVTSRWLRKVERLRPITIRWQVLSLSVLNEDKEVDPEGDEEGFLWYPVRVCAAVRDRHGSDALGRFYDALGPRFHRGEWGFEGALAEAGLPTELAEAATSTEYDAAVRASHAEGIGLVGTHGGTPIVAVPRSDGGRTAFFGPVISSVPGDEDAGRLWDGCLLVAGTPGFHELKGGPHQEPELSAPERTVGT